MTLGEVIRLYRESNRMPMQVFADRAGLSKGYISMLEKGKHPQNGKKIVPSYETISKVARGMGVTINDLISSLDGDQEILLDYEKNEYFDLTATESDLIALYRNADQEGQNAIMTIAKAVQK